MNPTTILDEAVDESVTLSGVNQEGGVIFRDDFETGYFVPSLWYHYFYHNHFFREKLHHFELVTVTAE
jgi:hypothetical protein